MGTTVHCDLEQEVRSFRSDYCADSRTLDAPESADSLLDKHLSKPIKSEFRWLALRGIC
jgi:predicted DNA-binding transcriptional regulator YafY